LFVEANYTVSLGGGNSKGVRLPNQSLASWDYFVVYPILGDTYFHFR
jgi:hypothetical protein